jgi:hypothetical protein
MDKQRIRATIRAMADSPKNVRFDEVENLLENHTMHLQSEGRRSISRNRMPGA